MKWKWNKEMIDGIIMKKLMENDEVAKWLIKWLMAEWWRQNKKMMMQ